MAMDNATTNAKDMVHGLSIVYNRARQAKSKFTHAPWPPIAPEKRATNKHPNTQP
jgi:hypothetical protein